MTGKTKIIPFDNRNFKIEQTGDKSIRVLESKINTPFGIVTVEEKSFSDLKRFDYLLLQMNFELEKVFHPIPVSGIPGAVCGRMYQYKYIGLAAEFTIGRPSVEENGTGALLDQEFSQVINKSVGPTFEIYYIPIATFELDESNLSRRTLTKIICQDEKMIISFFANYYGLGEQD